MANNRYYKNSEIDYNVLHSLPDDGSVDNQLPQLQNKDDIFQDNKNEILDIEGGQLNYDNED
ncbi:12513_t:CDS:1, partial [Racocetra fulgida]